MKKLLTLCIIQKDSQVLLGMKKRGFGAGRWNGFGGKVEEGESIEFAAQREVMEEAGVDVKDLEKMGILNFAFQDGSKDIEVHIFRSQSFVGIIAETDEMKPQWFPAHALPLLLQGKKFTGTFLYDRPSTAEYASVIVEKKLDIIV